MSCVREASPPLQDAEHLRHDIKKRRFLQPLRGLRRIFRRKGRPVISSSDGNVDVTGTLHSPKENFDSCEQAVEATNLEPAKSHSTSHLTDDPEDNTQRRSLQSTLLSVSHDSVFTSEQRSPDSGSETSLYVHTRLGFPHSSVRAELFEAVRRRRGVQENNASDDEDLGLPRSPVSNSPTTADEMFTKENMITKSSQSTCSDGSLLSMGSSEIDEESFYHSSRHSSKLSLYEKRVSTGSDFYTHNEKSPNTALNNDSGTSLSHSAAKHKMAVKPKRNHGVPHKKRQLITSNVLPATPEVNEENNATKCVVVEDKQPVVADTGLSDEHQSNQNHVYKTRITELNHTSVTQINTSTPISSAVAQSKSCSLPPGVSLSPVPSFKLLTRSKSNVASNLAIDDISDESLTSEKDSNCKKEDVSFFSRLLLRRSSKKKKTATIDETDASAKAAENPWPVTLSPVSDNAPMPYVKDDAPQSLYLNGNAVTSAMKHHPLFRQRVEPMNLPLPSAELAAKPPPPLYSSTVPVNAGDGKQPMKKSQSFRNHEKLPYMCYEDTPSLPINIGLVQEEDEMAITGRSRFNANVYKHRLPQLEPYKYSYSLTPDTSNYACVKPDLETEPEVKADSPTTPEYAAVSVKTPPAVEPLKWKPSTKLPDYSNVSIINCSKVSINVNDSLKNTDAKVPIPAPRISLLNRSPETVNPAVGVKNAELVDDIFEVDGAHCNVTVTETADGQKSIISIVSATPPPAPAEEENHEKPQETPVEHVEEKIDMAEAIEDIGVVIKEPKVTEEPVSKPMICVEKPAIPADKPIIIKDLVTGNIQVNDTVVTVRKKREVTPSKDDEPELMKVFARRSLKLKESDSVEEMLEAAAMTKSRDSDKENEDLNMPTEDRKKIETPKLPTTEAPKSNYNKFYRSISYEMEPSWNGNAVLTSNSNEKRQRCKSASSDEKSVTAAMANGEEKGEKIEMQKENVPEEKVITPFKRIQQRREEWEKRAQQAMKVGTTK